MNEHPTETNALRMPRHFLPLDFTFTSWAAVEPVFNLLAERELHSVQELQQWLSDLNELSSAFSEEMAWRYIHSSVNTTDEAAEAAYEFFVSEFEPNASPWFNRYNEIVDSSPFRDQLDPALYANYLRNVRSELAIYREANIPLFVEIDNLKQRYGRITGAMVIVHDGQELTLPQAALLLQNTDRDLRETVMRKVWQCRAAARDELNDLFDQLCRLRQQVAANAGFANFRDYMFAALGRFDYTPADCFAFHDAIAEEVVPLLVELNDVRRQKLGVDSLRPWDMEVDADGFPPTHPFTGSEELIAKTSECLNRVKPVYADYLRTMDRLGHFDLESRKGKAPGGYNYPLPVSGVPFIFMNASGSIRDVMTMLHEAGHAIHSFLMNPLPLNVFRDPPSEVAELASMSMELIGMEHWQHFFTSPEEEKRARFEQLAEAIETLPRVAAVDAFQHWVYEHPAHTPEERATMWKTICNRFTVPGVNWDGLDAVLGNLWQRQLHIYEIPFYYIEYAMAQLGALAVWRNYRSNPDATLQQYENALQLGYLRPIGEIYATAGIRFDFSREYVRELVAFVRAELNTLQAATT